MDSVLYELTGAEVVDTVDSLTGTGSASLSASLVWFLSLKVSTAQRIV